ncbi:SPRY-domain-containing protein [Wolfiporia cocos MD-104 SS10]|uniref:SPRY-domain-containing protein n=1 Tax=Wolfiporia cocos (strain MD-104) TaxID=742152 RepID=A0A2H3ISS5_WOLCO|nr:SPRY-domain-containing protein [Wolfiporia cocos MD-104 SS10]
MTTRPSRSASIPSPSGASYPAVARSLDINFSIPFTRPGAAETSPRARRTSTVSRSPVRARGPSTSPVRSTHLSSSFPISLPTMNRGVAPGQRPQASSSTFQPRIVRQTSSPASHHDTTACVPGPAVSSSPTRVRRPSLGVHSAPAPTIVRSTPPYAPLASPFAGPTPPSHATTHADGFPLPAYLQHSILSDHLCTDPAQIAQGSRSTLAAPYPGVRAQTIVPASYPYLRRSPTPAMDSDSEGTPSPSPPPETQAIPTTTVLAPLTLMLPTRWNEQDRNALLSLTSDGCDLSFSGPSCTGEKDAAAARANHPIPPACGVYYFEVEILSSGSKGHISIGFSADSVRLSRIPGWEARSWGYHADDGYCFQGAKDGSSYGPTFGTGDVIGCGIDFAVQRAFYTKNGIFIKHLFDNIPTNTPLFPSVGMRHSGESIRVNFGATPFRYAIEDYVRMRKDKVWDGIMRDGKDWDPSKDIDDESGGMDVDEEGSPDVKRVLVEGVGKKASPVVDAETRATLHKLVLSYLEHHGYARTARAFRSQVARDNSLDPLPLAPVKREDAMDTDDYPKPSTSGSKPISISSLVHGPTHGGYDNASSDFDDLDPSDPETRDLQMRLSILNAVRAGDIDRALEGLHTHYPSAAEAQEGLLLFRLRCRKFVELVLAASAAFRRVKDAEKDAAHRDAGAEMGADGAAPELDGEGAMDVDDPSPEALSPSVLGDAPTGAHKSAVVASLSEIAKSALHEALAYGQGLEADYKADNRPTVRLHLRRTFGVVAYDDPENAGGDVGAMAGQEARVELAGEVNQAILESQGRPVHPALETLYRQTGACLVHLGLNGTGAAAYADARQELLES